MLNSEWMVRMLAKSGRTPQDKLLALYDILADWVDAPNIRQSLSACTTLALGNTRLLGFLTEQARAAGFNHPEVLAHQFYLVALGALQEELRNPHSGALMQARASAETLLLAQRPRQSIKGNGLQRSIAIAMLAICTGMFMHGDFSPNAEAIRDMQTPRIVAEPVAQRSAQANPVQVASLYDAIDQIRSGVCQYPQALMLPSEQRSAFLEVVVDGKISVDNFSPQELHQLVRKVDCYYPPVALINS